MGDTIGLTNTPKNPQVLRVMGALAARTEQSTTGTAATTTEPDARPPVSLLREPFRPKAVVLCKGVEVELPVCWSKLTRGQDKAVRSTFTLKQHVEMLFTDKTRIETVRNDVHSQIYYFRQYGHAYLAYAQGHRGELRVWDAAGAKN
jgi:hypothetical protein